MNTTTTNLIATFRTKLAEATTNARLEIDAIRATITGLQRRLEIVTNGPLPAADVRVKIRACVDASAQYFVREHQAHGILFGSEGLARPDIQAQRFSSRVGGTAMSWDALCVADRKRAVAHLEALIAGVDYEAGPPLAERPALLAQLTRELQELEAAEEQAVDEAVAAGVSIEHRPEVRERREQEARTRAEQERIDAVTDANARQAAIDRQHAQRTAGRSQYITEGQRGPFDV